MRKENSKIALRDIEIQHLFPKPFTRFGKIWTFSLATLCVIGLFFYILQLNKGLGVTGMRDYTTWGIYVSNFVFFVAISLVGSLISAILKLSGAQWRTPLTRISEIIAVAAILFASIVIIIDMGRPERMFNLFFHARIQSPIIWDVIVISTYLVLSLLFLYIPLIPDFALLRDKFRAPNDWQNKLYKTLAIGWNNTPEQNTKLRRAEKILAITIIPVAFGIHTVTSWLFATTFRPGWDSSNFGPYFVSGAFMVGAAAVICAMYIIRKHYAYENYIQLKHFDYMGKLLLVLSFVYLYFNINEYFVPAYKMKASEAKHLAELFTGGSAPMFWSVLVFGMFIPIIILMFRKGRKPVVLFIVSIMVIVGAWFKRFLIVVPTLAHPMIPTHRVPDSWIHYVPTIPEWFITIATLCGALLIITLLIRYLPVIPITESMDAKNEMNSEYLTIKQEKS